MIVRHPRTPQAQQPPPPQQPQQQPQQRTPEVWLPRRGRDPREGPPAEGDGVREVPQRRPARTSPSRSASIVEGVEVVEEVEVGVEAVVEGVEVTRSIVTTATTRRTTGSVVP